MPSGEHESPIALAREDPSVITAMLARVFGVKVPDDLQAQPWPTEVTVKDPRSYRADYMALFHDAAGQAALATALESQLRWDPGKQWTWPLYVASLQSEVKVPTAL